MHACPACGDACDCRDDDLVADGLRDCLHACEDDDDDGDEPDEDEDDCGVGE